MNLNNKMIDLNEKNLEDSLYIMHHIDDLSAKTGRLHMASSYKIQK